MKKKFSLKNLQVESFVTSMKENKKETIKGGGNTDWGICFDSWGWPCIGPTEPPEESVRGWTC